MTGGGGRSCGNDRVTRARRARVAGMSGGSVWGRRGETAGKSRREWRRGRGLRKASVPSDLAHPARRRFVERPRRSSGSRSRGSSRSSPPRSCPRDLRRSSDPTLVALWRATRRRFARRLRQPPAARAAAPFGLPLRLRAPVRASRAVKPRSPAPFALRGMTRRTPRRSPPAPTARDPLSGWSRLPAVIRPPFKPPSPKLQRPSRLTWRVSASPPRKPPAANRWQPAQPSRQTQPLGTISILYPNPNAVKPFSKPILGIRKIDRETALLAIFRWVSLNSGRFVLAERAELRRSQACRLPQKWE